MTAPNYPDKDKVGGLTKDAIIVLSGRYKNPNPDDGAEFWAKGLADVCLDLWKERDNARATAALQDEAVHGVAARMYKLEKLLRAVREAKKTGYMPNFTGVNNALADIKKQEEGK